MLPDDDTQEDLISGEPDSETETLTTQETEQSEADWRAGIADEKLRKSVEKYSSVEDLVQAHNRLGGELRTRVKAIGADASDEDVTRYREAMGVPESTDGYEVTDVEGYEYNEADYGVIEDMKVWALDHNVPANAFDELVHSWVERSLTMRDAYESEVEKNAELSEGHLLNKWGDDYDRNLSFATRAANTFGGAPFIELLKTAKIEGFGMLGDSPVIVEILANIGRKIGESDVMLMTTADEKQGAQSRINEIMETTPPGTDAYKSEAVQRELRGLFALTSGERPVAGAPR